jgi:hypothetical protein
MDLMASFPIAALDFELDYKLSGLGFECPYQDQRSVKAIHRTDRIATDSVYTKKVKQPISLNLH